MRTAKTTPSKTMHAAAAAAAAEGPVIVRLKGLGARMSAGGLYSCYDERFPPELSNALSEHDFQRTILKINDDLANNSPCFTCNVSPHRTLTSAPSSSSHLPGLDGAPATEAHLLFFLFVLLRPPGSSISVLSVHVGRQYLVCALHVPEHRDDRVASRPCVGQHALGARRTPDRGVETRRKLLGHMAGN
jgi:hypothetical protein